MFIHLEEVETFKVTICKINYKKIILTLFTLLVRYFGSFILILFL